MVWPTLGSRTAKKPNRGDGSLVYNHGRRDTVYAPLSPVHTSNNVEGTFNFVAKNGNHVKRVLR